MEGLPSDTVYGYFEGTADKFHNKIALIYLGKKYSYTELKELIERFAASLQELGVKRYDKAILYLSNIPQWIIAWFGLLRLGAIPVPISPIYTPVDLKYMANDSGSETIICMDTNFGYVENALPETSVKRVIVTTMVELLPLWKRLLGKAFNRVPEGKFSLGKDTYSFKELLKNRSSSPLQSYKSIGIHGDDLVEMLYTGGTTGFPKGVPFSNLNLLNACLTQRAMSEPVIPKGEDIIVQGAPLFHALGQALTIGDMLVGDTCVLLPRVDLDGLFDHIQRYRATTFFGVPVMYRMILEHKRLDYYDLKSLKYCFCAGDVLPLEIAKRWLDNYGIPISQGYGATETCAGVSLTPANEVPPEGSAGKLLPGKEIKLVDPDTLEPVPSGEPGELLVYSDHMVTSYWNKPEETAACFVNMDGRLWYRTKDIVRIDKDSWLFFLDRSMDTIKHKGYRIAASEIEMALQEHPAVIASCVVGIPDTKVGERIKAFVILKEDVKGVTGYDLIKWCRTRLAPYKIPQYIEFRDMLPKSKVGKLLRREVRSEEKRRGET
jgi:long-chain acyl-CoA synthetase